MPTKELKDILRHLGFNSLKGFKDYMLSKAKLNDYGAICYTETRKGLELNYSDNCKRKFGIAATVSGQFIDERF